MNGVEIKAEWIAKPSDGKKCSECKCPTLGNLYNMKFTIGTEVVETKYNLCESCYNETLKT